MEHHRKIEHHPVSECVVVTGEKDSIRYFLRLEVHRRYRPFDRAFDHHSLEDFNIIIDVMSLTVSKALFIQYGRIEINKETQVPRL